MSNFSQTPTVITATKITTLPSPSDPLCDYVPPAHPARTLVLCFDGTGDSFDADNSNVVQFFSMLKKDDRKEQMVYYQAGIGTYTVPEIATPLMAKISKTLDMMIAWNLDAHVMDGYEFLMQNYTAGDKICLFGFSRGAYTARALAGMIHKVGLLPAGNRQQLPFAYKMYTKADEKGWKQSTAFKKAFSMDVDIEFIGVWDTVSSVGLVPRHLPFTTSNAAIRTFRHAISLDEHRSKFKENLFNLPDEREKLLGTQPGEMPKAGSTSAPETNSKHKKMKAFEEEFTEQDEDRNETDVLEVWFAGLTIHHEFADVGGGSVENSSRHNLARIPLRWMIRQCFLTNTGIRFHGNLLRTVGLDPASLYPVVLPRPPALPATSTLPSHEPPSSPLTPCIGYSNIHPSTILSEEEEDLADALCPIYDQLKIKRAWWALELLPVKQKVQQPDCSWVKEITVNLGRGRQIRKECSETFYVHRSVKTRMESEGLEDGKYIPKARFVATPIFVD
ncbi:hypothetical protein BU17DRAFT_44706 [Hysterangium stoloniferum]|nr:hypothetical protein BU17DRAFT_44706 [Hysterangium stoloniferum]